MGEVPKFKEGDTISFFEVRTHITSGGFGSVYVVECTEDDELYAMKTEALASKRQTLQFEIQVLKKLQNSDKFPRYKIDGKEQNFHFLVMELLGPNLDMVMRNLPGYKFDKSYAPRLFVEMTDILEHFHAHGYVHRDIKPQNFVVRPHGPTPLCLIDYGISRLYKDTQSGQHIQARDHSAAIGSPLYSSPNSHEHADLSRRDDFYSLIYSLLEICGVSLPWKGAFQYDVARIKKEHPISQLCEPLGPQFVEIAQHIESLGFADAPNYNLIRQICNKNPDENSQPFQWMTVPAKNKKFMQFAQATGAPFDPTGFIYELAPHMVPKKSSKNSNGKKCCVY